jgi:lipopolysaccharide export system permease protein
MLTLDRYITRIANRTISVVLAALLTLISMFALFEELGESKVTYGLVEAAAYIAKTLPRRIDELLAYSLFLGYLIALGRLAESNELTICRVSSMSSMRLGVSLVPSMLLWLAISFTVSEYIAPTTERIAEVDKMHAQFGDNALDQHGGLWLRDRRMFMRVRAIDEQGSIWGVSQYWLNDENAMVESVVAEQGVFDPEQQAWVLRQVTRIELHDASASRSEHSSWVWQNPITPRLLAAQAFLDPDKMSLADLYRQMEFARSQNLGVSEYELAFWTRVFKPLAYTGLALFALSVVLGPLREVSMGVRLMFGIFAGLGFKYLQDLFAPAAIIFNIPAIIAILIPIAVYWGVALLLIRRNA